MSILLDTDGPETVRLTAVEAHGLGTDALKRIGFPDDEAKIIMDQLVDNALCGYKFAGLPRLLAIAKDKKTTKKREPIRIVKETPLSALIDGGNNVGYITAYRAAEIAIRKAKTTGFASVGVHNSYYSGRNAYYAEMIAREGLVTMHVACGHLKVLPPGGTKAALGTNPICFAFPTSKEPFVFDMGTASLMWGEVLLYSHIGQQLEPGIAFDAEGNATQDAKAVFNGGGVVPFGGHKGFGLSFSVQTLGLLAGSFLAHGKVQDYGFLFWVLNPEIMLPAGDFQERLDELIEKVKATPRRPGVDGIRLPSERAFKERARRREEGILVDKLVVESIRSIGIREG